MVFGARQNFYRLLEELLKQYQPCRSEAVGIHREGFSGLSGLAGESEARSGPWPDTECGGEGWLRRPSATRG
jgi:hypothetical protein